MDFEITEILSHDFEYFTMSTIIEDDNNKYYDLNYLGLEAPCELQIFEVSMLLPLVILDRFWMELKSYCREHSHKWFREADVCSVDKIWDHNYDIEDCKTKDYYAYHYRKINQINPWIEEIVIVIKDRDNNNINNNDIEYHITVQIWRCWDYMYFVGEKIFKCLSFKKSNDTFSNELNNINNSNNINIFNKNVININSNNNNSYLSCYL
jgi:hypothetical protein